MKQLKMPLSPRGSLSDMKPLSPRAAASPRGDLPHTVLLVKVLKVASGKLATSSDVYGKILFMAGIGESEAKTKLAKRGVWEEAFTFYCEEKESRPFVFELWKKSSIGKDKYVGSASVNFISMAPSEFHTENFKVVKVENGEATEVGEVSLLIQYQKIKKVDVKRAEQQLQELLGEWNMNNASLTSSLPQSAEVADNELHLALNALSSEENLKFSLKKVSPNDIHSLTLIFAGEIEGQSAEASLVLPNTIKNGGEFSQGPIGRLLIEGHPTAIQPSHSLKVTITSEEGHLVGHLEAKSISSKQKRLYNIKGLFKIKAKQITESLSESGLGSDDKPFEVQGNLWHSVEKREFEKVKEYLERGDDVNAPNEAGNTPLHISFIVNVPTEVIELLVEKGANPSLKNKVGDSAVDLANKAGRKDILPLLNKYYF